MASQLLPGPRDPRVNPYTWMIKPATYLEGGSHRYGDVWALEVLGHGTFVVPEPALVEHARDLTP